MGAPSTTPVPTSRAPQPGPRAGARKAARLHLKENPVAGGSAGTAIMASQLPGKLNQDQTGQDGGNDHNVDVSNDFHRKIELHPGQSNAPPSGLERQPSAPATSGIAGLTKTA